MRTIIFLLAVIGGYSVSTLTCYYLPADSKDTKPTQTTCTSSCVKSTTTAKDVGAYYGCDEGGDFCKNIKNGKCKSGKTNGITINVCCCNDKDLCNSSGYFQPLIAIALIAKTYFY